MPKMARDLTSEDKKHYLATAKKREREKQSALQNRINRALTLADQAASLLRYKYSAERVVLFGSLTDIQTFTLWSDVDIAAWGLTADNFLKAMSDVDALDSEIEINLVDIHTAKASLMENILTQGQDI